jgi:hypothetical protein
MPTIISGTPRGFPVKARNPPTNIAAAGPVPADKGKLIFSPSYPFMQKFI